LIQFKIFSAYPHNPLPPAEEEEEAAAVAATKCDADVSFFVFFFLYFLIRLSPCLKPSCQLCLLANCANVVAGGKLGRRGRVRVWGMASAAEQCFRSALVVGQVAGLPVNNTKLFGLLVFLDFTANNNNNNCNLQQATTSESKKSPGESVQLHDTLCQKHTCLHILRKFPTKR